MLPPIDLLPDPLPPEPLELAAAWLAEASRNALQPNPNSMVLATVGAAGRPSARVVLCKDLVPRPGYVSFYTNYESQKGRDLAQNSHAAAVMHWDHLRRQVRIEGTVVRAAASDSDAYFASRPWQRRIGAWASAQSRPISSRGALVAAVRASAARFGAPEPGPEDDGGEPPVAIPRPPFWGGYYLWADAVELWVEGASRIHDRARWTRSLGPASVTQFTPGSWTATRLQP
jgi:pyridoxamine 5'-phosphate oxidase